MDKVANNARPALYQFEGGHNAYDWTNGARPRRTLDARLIVYLPKGCDADAVVATLSNTILDAIDAALATEPLTGRQTLGGTAYHCRIAEVPFVDPGDTATDGGMLVVAVEIVLP